MKAVTVKTLRELDALVHKRVFCENAEWVIDAYDNVTLHQEKEGYPEVPYYSTDANDMLKVLREFAYPKWEWFIKHDDMMFGFLLHKNLPYSEGLEQYEAEYNNLLVAVCLAALAAHGVDVELELEGGA